MKAPAQKRSPTVSVVIPAYNAERYIAEALDSVFAQTYQDFEVIVVDDGSTDETGDIVKQYGEPVQYVRKENGGSASARNRGIREAKGEYIAFLDADDLWLPPKLEKQVALLERDRPHRAWCYTDWEMEEMETGKILYRGGRIKKQAEGDVLRDLIRLMPLPMPSIVVHRKVVDTVGYFDESDLHRISEDYDFKLRVAAQFPVGLVPEPLVRIRKHPQKKTSTMDLDHALKSRLAILRKARDRDPDRVADLYDEAVAIQCTNAGRKWLKRENPGRARALFAKALRAEPTYWPAWQYGMATFLPRPLLHRLGNIRQLIRSW